MRYLTDLTARARSGARILVRADLNVPLRDGAVSDDTRIRATLPTITTLLGSGFRVVLCSHLGRPAGIDSALSLAPVARALSELLGQKACFCGGMPGDPATASLIEGLAPGELGLLENLRFHPGEKNNDAEFAQALVAQMDHFVNDAFGTCHRAHASVVGTAERRPAYAGLLVERELAALGELRDRPERPFWLVLGGSKVSDKIGVVANLRSRVDGFVVGGGMANTLLSARGIPVGGSRVEEDWIPAAREALEATGTRWELPSDAIVGADLAAEHGEPWAIGPDPGPDRMFLDIGPATVDRFRTALAPARTVFWNGPLGVFESPAFAGGTRAIAELLAGHPARVVLGGGDTAAAARLFGISDRVHHVCTGGGAALEFLEGRVLPGLLALEQSAARDTDGLLGRVPPHV